MNASEVVHKYIELRDKRSALKKRYEEEDAVYKAAMEKIELWLMQQSEIMGGATLSYRGVGIVFPITKMLVKCLDWGTLDKWVLDTGNTLIYERRISKDFVKKYSDMNEGNYPPAVNVTFERSIQVRRD